MRDSPGEIWNWPPYGGQGQKKERGRPLQMGGAGLESKGTYLRGLCWVLQGKVSTPACQNLRSLKRGLDRVQSYTPSRWSRHCSLKAASLRMAPVVGKVVKIHIVHPRGGGVGGKEPQITRVWFACQLTAAYFWWSFNSLIFDSYLLRCVRKGLYLSHT